MIYRCVDLVFILVNSAVKYFDKQDYANQPPLFNKYQHNFASSLPTFCCVLGKDTSRHFPLLGGPGKQF